MFHPNHKNIVYLSDKIIEEELTITECSPMKYVKEGIPCSGKICFTTYPRRRKHCPKRNRSTLKCNSTISQTTSISDPSTLQDPLNDQNILENEILKKVDITSDLIGVNGPISEAKAGPNTGIPSILSTLLTNEREDSEAGIRIRSGENDMNMGMSRNEYCMGGSARCLGEEVYNT
jgi:hypothetical protein